MKIRIPDFCLVAMVGVSGSGKSSFAESHFAKSEIVAPEPGRGLAALAEVIEPRLQRRCLTVVDAANVHEEERASLIGIAKAHYAQAVAIVLTPGKNELKPTADADLVHAQKEALRQGLPHLNREGFRGVHYLRSRAEMDEASIERTRLRTDLRQEQGPFDIVGDVHGCADELIRLLQKLGYSVELRGEGAKRHAVSRAPAGRRVVFVGDLVDRGPNSPDVLRIVMHMVGEGQALTVPGNHDNKLLRWMNGRKVKLSHGLAETVSQLEREPDSFREEVHDFIDGLASHVWLADGRLAVAHAGIKEEMMGRVSGAVREFCLYGETSGETDEFGLPIRYHWAAEYRGETAIVYGHTPVPQAEWLNNTLCIDTGCVFGGNLTALRWPEREIVSVPAARVYSPAIRPFAHPPLRPGYVP